MKLNLRGGLFRVWLILSAVFVVYCVVGATLDFRDARDAQLAAQEPNPFDKFDTNPPGESALRNLHAAKVSEDEIAAFRTQVTANLVAKNPKMTQHQIAAYWGERPPEPWGAVVGWALAAFLIPGGVFLLGCATFWAADGFKAKAN